MSRPSFVRLALIASVVSLLATSAQAQEPVELRWKFELGESFVTEWKQGLESRVTIQDAGGQTLRRIDTKYDLSMRIGWTVVSVAADGAVVTEQRIESLTLAVRAPGNVLRQLQLPGSDEPPKEFAALSKALDQALGAPIRVTLSPRGEPLSVELPEAWTKLAENEELGPSARQLSTPEGWKRLLASSTTPLPENAVAVGATWTTEDPPLGELPYRVTTDSTLAGVENDVATLTFRSKAEKSATSGAETDGRAGEGRASSAALSDAAGVAVTVTGFERTGTATFDRAGGTLLRLQSQTKLNLGKRSGEYLLSTQQSGAVTVETKPVEPQKPASESQAADEPANEN